MQSRVRVAVPALLAAALTLVTTRASSPAEDVAFGKRLAITVDDLPINGPDSGLLELRRINDRILEAFRFAGVPAVGFVNESKLYQAGEVDGRIALLEAWLATGFELGNHTFSHPDFNQVGVTAYTEEVVRGETVTAMLSKKYGRRLRYFRHTFLRTGKSADDKQAFEDFLAARGYTVAPVTLENDDWLFNQKYVKALDAGDTATAERIGAAYLAHWTTMFDWYEALSQRVLGRAMDHVILMHENALNADHLARVLALMRSRGYSFVPLERVLQDPAYKHADRYVGRWGKSWLQRWAFTVGIDTLGTEPDPPDWLMQLP